jgi:hypothetical protein
VAYVSFLEGLIEEELATANSYRDDSSIDWANSAIIHGCRRRIALVRQELIFMNLPELARSTAENDGAMIYCGRA